MNPNPRLEKLKKSSEFVGTGFPELNWLYNESRTQPQLRKKGILSSITFSQAWAKITNQNIPG